MQLNSVCATSPNGSSSPNEVISYTSDDIGRFNIEMDGNEPKYTTSFTSAGGGGGAYDSGVSGNGANGQGGFVYVWYKI